jgi:cytoskeletal protein CcmA (bactofilin family)
MNASAAEGTPATPGTVAAARHAPRRSLQRVDRGTVCRDEVRAPAWRVRGFAKVLRSVDAGDVEVTGTLVVGGPLTAERLTVHGALDAHGPVAVTGRLFVRGSLDAGATVRAGDATVRGPLRAAGEATVDGELRVHGSLRAAGVRAGRLAVHGTAEVPGTLAAASVDLDLTGDSTIAAVQGREVRVRGPAVNVVRRVLGKEVVVAVGSIEGETVTVEGSRIALVRSPSIVLGPGAHVVAVQGRVVRAHRTSRVGPEAWSRPPAGLSR